MQRQIQIEQNGQKRQWAAQHVAGQVQAVTRSDSDKLTIVLWPLFVVLGSILGVAWIKLIRDHLKRRAQPTELPVALENDKDITIDAVSPDGGHQ